MAKKAPKSASRSRTSRRRSTARARRKPAASAARKRSAAARKASRKKPSSRKGPSSSARPKGARRAAASRSRKAAPARPPARLNRERRVIDERVPTPPSSLNLNRHGSAARTGRAELAEARHAHAGMTPAITGGDVDADVENAYFSGDEAPGGDNPTPDQDIVDNIGRAIGVEYQDNEELRSSDKVIERDKHRWELDPASSEDYKERK